MQETRVENNPIKCPDCGSENTGSYKVGDLDRAYCKDCGSQWFLN